MKKIITTICICIVYSFVLICCGKSNLSQNILGSDIKRKTRKDPSYSEQKSKIESLDNYKDYTNTNDDIKDIFGNDITKFNLLCNEDKKENIYTLSYYKKSGNYGINRNNNLPTNSVFNLRIPFFKNILFFKNIPCTLKSHVFIIFDNKFTKDVDIKSIYKNFTLKIDKPSEMLVFRHLLEEGIDQKKLNNDIVKIISLYSFDVFDNLKKIHSLSNESDNLHKNFVERPYDKYTTCLKEYEKYIEDARFEKIADNLETICKFIDPYLKIDKKLLCVGYIRHYSNLLNKLIPTDIIKLIDKLYDNPKRKIHGKMYEEKEIIMNCSLYETPDILYIKVSKDIFESFHFSYFNGDKGKFDKYDETSDRLTKIGFIWYLMYIKNTKFKIEKPLLPIIAPSNLHYRYKINFDKMCQINTKTEFKSDILCSLSKVNTISS